MHRLTDPQELVRLLAENAREEWRPGIEEATEWLADPAHFALVEGNDLAMFAAEGAWPGPLHGHMFFASRGKLALTVAKAMLGHAFGLGATAILGRTPAKFKDAVLFARWLGFVKTGEEEAPHGKVIISRLDANPQANRLVA